MNSVIPLWTVPHIPLDDGGSIFPVRRIYCVGRNYAEHAREMGADPQREAPFFFMKPAEAILSSGEFPYPGKTADLQHEIELVVALAQGGQSFSAQQALDRVCGYAVGLDMTRRDLQAELKAKGRSWEMAKAFDHSAPVSPLVPVARCGHPQRGAITLSVNGAIRQSGDLADMIWPVAELLSRLSEYVTLLPGDIVFTGTPAGVGPLAVGDRLEGRIEGVGHLQLEITR